MNFEVLDTANLYRGDSRDSLHGDKNKRRQGELKTWAAGAPCLNTQKQLNTTKDQFMQVCGRCCCHCLLQGSLSVSALHSHRNVVSEQDLYIVRSLWLSKTLCVCSAVHLLRDACL